MPSWSQTPSGTMLAAVLTSPGSSTPSACFTIDPAYPRPTLPSPDWLLVRVRAAGLNRAELRGRNGDKPGLGEFGIFQAEYHEDPPKILGEEFVGVVEEAGKGCKRFEKGNKVAGWIYGGGKAHDGAYAEYTICHKRRCWKLPETGLGWEVLGAVPMSMWTAFGSLVQAGEVKGGETVLVHGGSSSVGVWAILLAKDRGCTVIATTRKEEKVERLKEAGADYVLLEERLEKEVKKVAPKGVDVVLELVGPDKLTSFTLKQLARHGTAVVTGVLTKQWSMNDFTPAMIPPTRKLTFYGMTNRGSLGDEDEELEDVEDILKDVIKKTETGTFKKEVFLDRVFRLEDIGKAHEYIEDNSAVGKVVLTIP